MKLCAFLVLSTLCLLSPVPRSASAADYRERAAEDEIVYFVLPDRFDNADPSNDRGGLKGDRLKTGFDPTNKGFYHGGDLDGVTRRLDYIQGLGATALWLAPVFVNQPVQGPEEQESAGYHGYWITDFTRVDPHFGDNAALFRLIAAAHTRGMKVYLDIVMNHTADVIRYRQCAYSPCAYRSKADYPYQRKGGVDGAPINSGFLGDDAAHQTEENYSHLTRSDYAYTPYVPADKIHLKKPEWLNDPIYYHNRGDSTFSGESSTLGDFFGLDDLMTENPRVVQGFIDIYGRWITEFGVDGFRIDTAQHVNPEFFDAFVPAMLERARALGRPNFHIFGEVYTTDTALLAAHTHMSKLPSVLDFAFAKIVREVCLGQTGTQPLANLFKEDLLYQGGAAAALRLPVFVSNHDQGRFGYFMFRDLPGISESEALARARLATAMTLTLRGVPVIYYGDEQGFAGSGGDMDARQDMGVSQVISYRFEKAIGGSRSRDMDHFDAQHPLYLLTQELAHIRTNEAALRRGLQILRAYSDKPGLFAVSRVDPADGHEVLLAFNTSTAAIDAHVETSSSKFKSLHGNCAETSAAGSVRVALEPLDFAICAAER